MSGKFDDWTPEELAAALARGRDRNFALLVATVVELAAESHPEELRKSLAKVFDVSQFEKQCEQIAHKNHLMYQDFLAVRDAIKDAEADLVRLWKQSEELQQKAIKARAEIEELRQTTIKVRTWLKAHVVPRMTSLPTRPGPTSNAQRATGS